MIDSRPSPLLLASALGYVETVQQLLAAKADITATYQDGKTALHYVARSRRTHAPDRLQVAELLIAQMPNVDVTDLGGDTPLMEAVRQVDSDAPTAEEFDMVRLLLRSGADINRRDQYGQTPLLLTANNRAPQLSEGESCGLGPLIQMLVEAGADINDADPNTGQTPLMLAVKNGNEEMVRHLLSLGSDVNTLDKDGESAWGLARREEKRDITIALENAGAVEPPQVWEDLHTAVLWGNYDAVEQMLSKGVEINRKNWCGMTALAVAVQYPSDSRILPLLLASGSNVNETDLSGGTALREALYSGNIQAVPLLLERGANPHSRSNEGRTLLCDAVETRDIHLVRLFLEVGCDINSRDNPDGMTAILCAKTPEMVEFLAQRGANINAQTENYGQTALHFSYYSRRYDVFAALLAHGADPSVENEGGKTVLSAAISDGVANVVRLLIDAGADVNKGVVFEEPWDGYGNPFA